MKHCVIRARLIRSCVRVRNVPLASTALVGALLGGAAAGSVGMAVGLAPPGVHRPQLTGQYFLASGACVVQ